MSIRLAKASSEAPEFEEGVYTLRVTDLEVDEENKYNGVSRPQIVWSFDVVDGPSDLRAVKGYTSLSYFEGSSKFPPSKLYKWLRAIGVEPTFGEDDAPELPVALLKTLEITAQIDRSNTGWPKVIKLYKVVSTAAQTLAKDVEESWKERENGSTSTTSETAPAKAQSPGDDSDLLEKLQKLGAVPME